MQVLNVLSFIIERVGWEIAPFFDSLVNYLPMLWQHAEGHNMLRCAIVSVLTQIVRVSSCTNRLFLFCEWADTLYYTLGFGRSVCNAGEVCDTSHRI